MSSQVIRVQYAGELETKVYSEAEGGRPIFVASTYASVGSLLDPAQPRVDKLREISTLPVTEIVEVRTDG